jgi:hypothetical protein
MVTRRAVLHKRSTWAISGRARRWMRMGTRSSSSPAWRTFTSATFTATLSPTSLNLSDGSHFVASGALSADLIPSSGSLLQANAKLKNSHCTPGCGELSPGPLRPGFSGPCPSPAPAGTIHDRSEPGYLARSGAARHNHPHGHRLEPPQRNHCSGRHQSNPSAGGANAGSGEPAGAEQNRLEQ